jgi:hypothetical protein
MISAQEFVTPPRNAGGDVSISLRSSFSHEAFSCQVPDHRLMSFFIGV